jgi:dTDP-glucose pyrophosphorylase
VLGDNYFEPKIFLKDIITFHCTEHAVTTVGVAEVQDVTRHGIITPDGNRIIDIHEKPSVNEAASNLGALGAYVFDTSVFDAIRATKPGVKGEYQLTDSIRVQIQEGKRVLFKKIDGIHIDVGTPVDLMRANERYLRENRLSDEG